MANPRKRKLTNEEVDELDIEFRVAFTDLLTSWATVESGLRGIFAGLLRVDQWRADLIMYSVFSTRVRVDMVQRLAILMIHDKRKIKHLQKLLRQLKPITDLRNRLAHSVYHYKMIPDYTGNVGAITGMTFVNFTKANFDGGNMYERRDLDRGLFNEMKQMTLRGYRLSFSFERFAKALEKSDFVDGWLHVRQPQQERKPRKAKGRRSHPEKAPKRKRPPKSSQAKR